MAFAYTEIVIFHVCFGKDKMELEFPIYILPQIQDINLPSKYLELKNEFQFYFFENWNKQHLIVFQVCDFSRALGFGHFSNTGTSPNSIGTIAPKEDRVQASFPLKAPPNSKTQSKTRG